MAVGGYVRDLLAGAGLAMEAREDLPAPPRVPQIGEHAPRPYQDADLISRDPAYGEIVCFCFRLPLPTSDLRAPLPAWRAAWYTRSI